MWPICISFLPVCFILEIKTTWLDLSKNIMGCFQLLFELYTTLELFVWLTINVVSRAWIWTVTHPEIKKNWAQTVLCCYCRIFTILVLWHLSAFCQLLYVDLPYMLSGSFCSDTKVHYVMFLQTTQVCQKWLLFEVQSGFWRLCPRDLLWRPETFDQLPTVEVTDIRNLTLETSCQPLFHYCYFYWFFVVFFKKKCLMDLW